jgi:hypothetical protein
MKEKAFEPKSGMILKTVDGCKGLFVDTEKGLWIMYANSEGAYSMHTRYTPDLLTSGADHGIVEIYLGMGEHGNSALNYRMGKDFNTYVNEIIVWSRKPSNKVKIGEYQAEIDVYSRTVKVGCQIIPFEEITALVNRYTELRGD